MHVSTNGLILSFHERDSASKHRGRMTIQPGNFSVDSGLNGPLPNHVMSSEPDNQLDAMAPSYKDDDLQRLNVGGNTSDPKAKSLISDYINDLNQADRQLAGGHNRMAMGALQHADSVMQQIENYDKSHSGESLKRQATAIGGDLGLLDGAGNPKAEPILAHTLANNQLLAMDPGPGTFEEKLFGELP